MTEPAALVDTYCDVWSQPDGRRRAALLASVWGPAATYTDPSVHAADAAELLAHIAKVRARWPGASVSRTSRIDFHHGIARFRWHLMQANGVALPEGLDIAFIAPHGARIERIIGFFGPLEPQHAQGQTHSSAAA